MTAKLPVVDADHVITNSRLTCIRECKRKHYYAYLRKRRARRPAKPLVFGDVVHAGLAAWWLHVEDGQVAWAEMLATARDRFMNLCVPGDEPPLEGHDIIRLESMLEAYHARWWPTAEEWEVVGIEEEFRAPLVNPATGRQSQLYVLGGKLDGRIRRRSTGRLLGLEHKTSSQDISAGAIYWVKLRMDPQVSLYSAAGAALGEPLDGFLYDVLAKPRHRPLLSTPLEKRTMTKGKPCKKCKGTGQVPGIATTGMYDCEACNMTGWVEPPRAHAGQRLEDESLESYGARVRTAIAEIPDSYLMRTEVVRLDAEIDEHAFDTWQQVKEMHEGVVTGRFPRNPDACFMHGNEPCAYFGVCTGTDSIENDAVFRDSGSNEELGGEEADGTE